jgi:hypothetical protein
MTRLMNATLIGAVGAAAVGLMSVTALAQTPPGLPQETADITANKTDVAEANFQKSLDQFQNSSRVKANEDIPPSQRLLVDYGAYLTFDYLSVQDPTGNTHILREEDLVAYGLVNLDNVQSVFVRGRVSNRDYSTGDSFGGTIQGTGQHSALEQLYYHFDLQKYLGAYKNTAINDDASVNLGRQSIIWGNGLAFNEDIDGGVLDIIKGPFSVEGVAGQTVPDTIDFDTSRPGFNDRTQRGFFGVLVSAQVDRHKPFIYYLSQRDLNSDNPLIISTTEGTLTTNFDYNSNYLGAGSTGSLNDRLAYGFEADLEQGNTLSNSYIRTSSGIMPVTQKREDILAFAGDGRLDYVFPDPHNTRASTEVIFASGDHSRDTSTNTTFGGVKPGTKDLAYNGFGLLNTGLAFAPDVSNILIGRVGVSTQPFNAMPIFKKLELGADAFIYSKYLERAPIDEPTSDGPGGYLGWEPDFFMNWQITSDLTLAMRYGVFEPSDRISTNTKARQLLFTGVTFAF